MTLSHRQRFALVALVGLTLAGCGKHQGAPSDDAPSSSSATSGTGRASDAPSANDKLNAYVDGYNGLLSPFGLPVEYRLYAGQMIARKGINDPVNVSAGWMDQALDSLKKARAMPADGLGDLDAAADRMIAPLDQLVTRLKALNIYYQSRGQLTDNFARGKREDPLVLQEFQQSMAAMAGLDAALDQAIDRRDQAELDGFKQHDDMIGYNGALAMQKAKALINLFHAPDDIRNPAIVAKADALVATIEHALADERTELAEAKGKRDDSGNALRNSMASTAADRLTTMVGHYRDFKASGSPFGLQMMTAAYNSAVDETNMGQVGR